MSGVFQGLAGIAMLFWYTAAICVGARLLRIGRNDGHRPASLMGTYLLVAMGMGSIAMSIPMARGMEGAVITWADRAAFGAGCILTTTGIAAILIFTREVFRPKSTWATGLAISIASIVAAGVIGHGLTTGFESNLESRWIKSFVVGTILANGWTAVESLRYWAMMRKRMGIGLADPILTNRFLLWGMGAGSSVLLLVLSLSQEFVRAELGPDSYGTVRDNMMPLISLFGLCCASSYWFAFAPAGWYTRWIQRGAKQ